MAFLKALIAKLQFDISLRATGGDACPANAHRDG